MMTALVLLSCLLLAYVNGANDNFKGVATLYGSGTAGYGKALAWATVTTFLGSLAAVLVAGQLLKNFSGKGLVDESLVSNTSYTAAVALGAGLTVALATRVGMPISTTHSLVGSLVGAGIASGSPIDVSQLGGSFFLPLLVSPIVAVTVTATLYPLLRAASRPLGITSETCLCVGGEVIEVLAISSGAATLARAEQLTLSLGTPVTCQQRFRGRFFGVEAHAALDRLHFLTAGAVSFARGLNDTPKIAALLLVAPALGDTVGIVLVGLAIALGGILNARRVADTMSRKITTMDHAQGCTANFTASLIVIGASPLGLPVSTTHVACGALFGIGAVTGQGRWATIATIMLAWITTLPIAIGLGALSGWLVRSW
jgi:PiT family inorganic phosphate transporter